MSRHEAACSSVTRRDRGRYGVGGVGLGRQAGGAAQRDHGQGRQGSDRPQPGGQGWIWHGASVVDDRLIGAWYGANLVAPTVIDLSDVEQVVHRRLTGS